MYHQFNIQQRYILHIQCIYAFCMDLRTKSDYFPIHRNNILLYKSPHDAQVTEAILSDNCSTCFGHHQQPSPGAQANVTTASGNRYTILLSAAVMEDNTLKSVPTLPR